MLQHTSMMLCTLLCGLLWANILYATPSPPDKSQQPFLNFDPSNVLTPPSREHQKYQFTDDISQEVRETSEQAIAEAKYRSQSFSWSLPRKEAEPHIDTWDYSISSPVLPEH